MGKNFNKDTIGITAVVLAIVILLSTREAYPAYREAELFDLGYEQYLSSQPEKAVEAFTLFLGEFPRSSAKDAAMFWMAKCLIQMRRDQEAKGMFEKMTREFPESPLNPLAIREIEKLGEADVAKVSEPIVRGTDEGEERHMEALQRQEEWVAGKSAESSAPPTGHTTYSVQVAALSSEEAANRLKKKLKQQGIEATIKKTSFREGTRCHVLTGEFGTKREADLYAIKIRKRTGLDAFSIKVERSEGGASAPLSQKGPLGPNAERETSGQLLIPHKNDSGKSETREPVMTKKDEMVAILIEGTQYTAQQVSTFMNNSFAAILKLGIKEVIWRTGNVYEDFINEQVLYEEAKRAGVIHHDERGHEKTEEKYRLSPEEADYLQRYFAISDLVDKKLKERPAERVVESLIVRYTDGDRREKELLASELQGHAKSGKPFGEIYALYPQRVSYAVTEVETLQKRIKNEIVSLENGEISVFWSKEGYIILKPALQTLSFEPFEDMDQGKTNTVRALVREYIAELRKEKRKIEIVRDDKGEP